MRITSLAGVHDVTTGRVQGSSEVQPTATLNDIFTGLPQPCGRPTSDEVPVWQDRSQRASNVWPATRKACPRQLQISYPAGASQPLRDQAVPRALAMRDKAIIKGAFGVLLQHNACDSEYENNPSRVHAELTSPSNQCSTHPAVDSTAECRTKATSGADKHLSCRPLTNKPPVLHR